LGERVLGPAPGEEINKITKPPKAEKDFWERRSTAYCAEEGNSICLKRSAKGRKTFGM